MSPIRPRYLPVMPPVDVADAKCPVESIAMQPTVPTSPLGLQKQKKL